MLTEIPRLLRGMNVEPAPVLRAAGVEPSTLADIENHLPFAAVSALMLECARATGRPDFALAIGASARLWHLGAIGRLLQATDNFGAALVEFAASHPRYVRGAGAYLIDLGEDGVMIGHRVHFPGLRGSVPFSAGALAFGRSVFEELCGVEPVLAHLSVAAPDDPSPYRIVFGRAKLVFGAEHCGLVYPRAALSRPVKTADRGRYDELRTFIARRWTVLEPDLRERVLRVLAPSVLAGQDSLAAVSARLDMHPRALNRALQQRGTTFRDLLGEARFEIACQLLRDTGMSVGGLARTLGYSEVSAFTRFFTAAAGLPPTEWRQRQLVEGNGQEGP